MRNIEGIEAIRLAQEVSKLPDGTFKIAFYPCNLATGEASSKLRIMEGCKTRAQLPREQWEADGDAYFLFQDKDGEPKTCHRVLLRFIGFPNDGFQLHKVNWFKQ